MRWGKFMLLSFDQMIDKLVFLVQLPFLNQYLRTVSTYDKCSDHEEMEGKRYHVLHSVKSVARHQWLCNLATSVFG
jgi:truncated hemoglobin YjbI